jgi:chemotaxis protein histidine kinase CheA
MDGRIDIVTKPGNGTRIHVQVPLSPQVYEQD